ncbi:MAG TPA: hypothetical protein DEQ09_01810 [Bacteroidales bacterium]|nr:hypothetical protein [Bacteroidales bacterium]
MKKDIDYLVYEVVSDCFTAMSINQKESVSDDLAEIVSDAVKLRNDLFSRARYRVDNSKPESPKQYYRKMRSELVTRIDGLFVRLSKVIGS